jgi:hypothetical protein
MNPKFVAWLIAALALLCLIAMAVLLPVPASAHSSVNPANNQLQIYDSDCCSGRDCEPIPYDAVWQEDDGWHVQYVSKRSFRVSAVVPFGKERLSRDGRMHGCAIPNYFRCLYITLGL